MQSGFTNSPPSLLLVLSLTRLVSYVALTNYLWRRRGDLAAALPCHMFLPGLRTKR
jgi:hypothetical protein